MGRPRKTTSSVAHCTGTSSRIITRIARLVPPFQTVCGRPACAAPVSACSTGSSIITACTATNTATASPVHRVSQPQRRRPAAERIRPIGRGPITRRPTSTAGSITMMPRKVIRKIPGRVNSSTGYPEGPSSIRAEAGSPAWTANQTSPRAKDSARYTAPASGISTSGDHQRCRGSASASRW